MALLVAGWLWWRADNDALLQQARAAFLQRDYIAAADLADQVLQAEPDHLAALRLAGDAAFETEHYDQALTYYLRMLPGSSDTQLHSRLRCGRIEMHHNANAPAAEEHFRIALQHLPNHRNALFQLASLLGIQARRDEAVPLILRLFRQGVLHVDLLHLLESDRGALFNIEELDRYRQASPNAPGVLVGLAWHADRAGNQQNALELLAAARHSDPDFPPARVALAELLWDLNRYRPLRELFMEPQSDDMPGARFWLIQGQLAEHDGLLDEAARCYWETLHHDPTNREATYRLYQYFSSRDDTRPALWLQERIQKLLKLRTTMDQLASLQNRDPLVARRLIEQLEQVGRLWESWAWAATAQQTMPAARWAAAKAQTLQVDLQQAPLKRVCRPPDFPFDLSSLPLPTWHQQTTDVPAESQSKQQAASFRNDAQRSGLSFRYFNSPSPAEDGQRMYEFNGGGAGVIDVDADGWPDLWLTQGCRWTERGRQNRFLDQLFRNKAGSRFDTVTGAARLVENGFSTGLAVGDLNNDGFADAYVANIGGNRLFQNNGDGTFTDITATAQVADAAWSTSCAMADLNGDALPDLYSVNYLKGDGIFDAVCQHDDGRPRMCMPFHFPGAQDQFYLNLGDGRFDNATDRFGFKVEDGKGLGIVVANWQDDGQPAVFIANDTVANSFFVQQPSAGSEPVYAERAMAAGVALNREGRAEGCMGIAVGDVDDDGAPDLFVTNFLHESNTFYQAAPGPYFADATSEFGLAEPSLPMLGFGTQFLDANLDGRLDLIVANGHIDDYRPYGRPYYMSPQFFRNAGGGRFVLQSADQSGPYFTEKYLGRSVARIDWNRDGREDMVISNLDQPAALLTNTTAAHGRCVVLRLIGVRSPRDAIGATVTAGIGDRTLRRQVTAGDGYQASNQRSLVFGLADAESLDGITVRWPAGLTESFGSLRAGRQCVLVEGTGRPLALPESPE